MKLIIYFTTNYGYSSSLISDEGHNMFVFSFKVNGSSMLKRSGYFLKFNIGIHNDQKFAMVYPFLCEIMDLR